MDDARSPAPAAASVINVPGQRGGAPGSGRIESIDFARGLAVVLMILSHGVNALLPFSEFPDWGQVPVHALTKFSSSLFVIVFGVALAVAFVPKVHQDDWPRRRNRLLWRGLVVLVCYKLLTVVEMYQLHEREAIVDTLLYRDFPSFVEILGFYAIALLWVPFVLPLWARTPMLLRWASPVLMALACWWLLENFDFWGAPQLQALLVEHPDYYTWGQLARGPLVLVGLLIGGLLLQVHDHPGRRMALAGAQVAAGLLAFAALAVLAGDNLADEVREIAGNAGKHPPGLLFMLYSVGGALALLGLAIAGGGLLARWLKPVSIIGSDALMAFVFHIVVIFVLFRDLLGYHQDVTYEFALLLAVLLIPATALFVWLLQVARRSWRRRSTGEVE
ncbi:heparan-alpha-glucosaminide N-acetyltransferase domain-containing protein [Luteimonas qiangzhengi]|uniref:heparan-alpha-glucosaminide N-acetyltransferase domain-containing protein n=1 Tax=Luteimonas sp. MJ146 TaxID=3129240 RepID=UPI0031BA3E82